MSQTKARRIYRRWNKYIDRCNKIGGSPGRRMPLSAERAELTLFLRLPKIPFETYTGPPLPPPPTIILHGWPG